VELLFNLLWLALSCVLVSGWLFGSRRLQKSDPEFTTRKQIIALAMLIVILLPVVSLTDDLQACTTPAEMEHLGRRIDLLPSPDHAVNQALIVEASLVSFHQAALLQTLAAVSPAMQVERPCAGYLCHVGNRPPPVA
jgi:hypothetical protein